MGDIDMGTISIPTCFYGTTCHVCRASDSTTVTLKRCSGCKMIAYCSSVHQKLHWPKHRKICKSVQFLLKEKQLQRVFDLSGIGIGMLPSVEEWKRVRLNSMLLIELIMKRKLIQEEREMFFFPRVCQVCRECSQEMLIDCIQCHCVSYCSSSHQMLDKERHLLSCPLLKTCYYMDNSTLFSVNYRQYLVGSSLIIPALKDCLSLPLNIELFLQRFVPFEGPDQDIHIAFCSELLTWPLTLLYCLENIVRENENKSANMVVHIVGASIPECSSVYVWEVILHWLPYIKHLQLVLIGPNVVDMDTPEVRLCDDCTQSCKLLSLDCQKGILYKDYFQSSSFIKPDLVVAYNCGFHEFENSDDTWAPSIPLMLKFPDTGLVITSYTASEADSDISRVVQCVDKSVNVLMRCQDNPFCSKRPYRDWEHNGSEVFFFNAFLSLLIT